MYPVLQVNLWLSPATFLNCHQQLWLLLGSSWNVTRLAPCHCHSVKPKPLSRFQAWTLVTAPFQISPARSILPSVSKWIHSEHRYHHCIFCTEASSLPTTQSPARQAAWHFPHSSAVWQLTSATTSPLHRGHLLLPLGCFYYTVPHLVCGRC